ncbi:DUF1045 domain-containing protein [Dyella monticola]|uniref:DUF1045 domain-containing protein n=1 Tax=Dyella monticola TaxID=1927958 RepID=A0A370WS99_9GAMM|nr:DUF1045 domain-containing protein [Dyella monticola]RDS78907.1 DUF1045 domain-containing protein [Dyella monticola]
MRYAVYFCPAQGSALDVLGRAWLSAGHLPGVAADRLRALTVPVRRYGWHATLCAPFVLAEAASYDDLRRDVADIAQHARVIELPLQLDRLAHFLALRPSVDEASIRALSERCVRRLNALRAANTEAAWQRRAAHLDDVETALFREFGYPYVLDRYRFHMTVSAPASEEEERALRDWFHARVESPLIARIDAFTLCRENAPGEAFQPIDWIPFGAGHAT